MLWANKAVEKLHIHARGRREGKGRGQVKKKNKRKYKDKYPKIKENEGKRRMEREGNRGELRNWKNKKRKGVEWGKRRKWRR